MEVAFLQGDLKGLHVKPIAGEDTAMVAPARVRGGAPAAGIGGIDDVIVNQRGAVEEFNDGGEFDGALAATLAAVGVAVSEQEQRRTKPLPSPAEQIAGDFRDGLIGGGALAGKFLLDPDEVFADQFKNFFDR